LNFYIFIILTFIAILVYPIWEYDFFKLNLSDLAHRDLGLKSWIISFAMILIGVCSIPFYLVNYNLFKDYSVLPSLFVIPSITGIISSVILIGIGVWRTPSGEHSFAANYFFRFMVLTLFLYIFVLMSIRKDPEYRT